MCLEIQISFKSCRSRWALILCWQGDWARKHISLLIKIKARENKQRLGGSATRSGASSLPAFERLSFLSQAEWSLGDEKSRLWIWKINRNLSSFIFLFARYIIFNNVYYYLKKNQEMSLEFLLSPKKELQIVMNILISIFFCVNSASEKKMFFFFSCLWFFWV